MLALNQIFFSHPFLHLFVVVVVVVCYLNCKWQKNALDNRNFIKIQLQVYIHRKLDGIVCVCHTINKTNSIQTVNIRQATLKKLIENLRFSYRAAQNFQTE